MKITIEKDIICCDQCPHFNEIEDTSVCFDSFDDPNYEWYCQHPTVQNKHIGGAFRRIQCTIPEWCPFKN